jgi:replicative DNA helicase
VSAIDHYMEERLLGALLQAGSLGAGGRAFARSRGTGLEPRDFWRRSFGELYRVLGEMADRDLELDPLSVAAELRDRARRAVGPLDELHGVDEPRLLDVLYRLAHEPTYIACIERFARLIHEAGERRRREESESTARPGRLVGRSGLGEGGIEA